MTSNISLRLHLLSAVTKAIVIISMAGAVVHAATPKKPLRKLPQTAAPKSEPSQCQKLRGEYDDASKKLALANAYESIDDSAMRSTMRNSENSNIIAQARMTFDIMKSAGCKLPTYAPSADRYGSDSLSCMAALQKQRTNNAMARLDDRMPSFDTPHACDTSAWFTATE